MKIQGRFMKVVLLNEIIKHPLFKPNSHIGRFFYLFYFSTSILFNKHNFP
jgi:hypothetical protein